MDESIVHDALKPGSDDWETPSLVFIGRLLELAIAVAIA